MTPVEKTLIEQLATIEALLTLIVVLLGVVIYKMRE